MSRSSFVELRKASSLSRENRESNGTAELDDPERTTTRVAQLVDQLHANVSSPQERELTTARLLGIAKARKEARALIGSHGQAMSLFVSILRTGTLMAKVNVASTLTVLCKEEDLRVKVLLGGCIPPLLSVLKAGVIEARKAAAEALFKVSSGGLSDVGIQIFVTEGVVPTLWEQLTPKNQDKVVEGFITGALRNLCGDKDGNWRASLDAGGVDIVVRLLSSDNHVAQANAASLLARLMLVFTDSIVKIIDSGAIKILLRLLNEENDALVRASAAEALEAFSLKSTEAKNIIDRAQGMYVLIGAIVAPSKGVQGETWQILQQRSMHTLANIYGGMRELIFYLGELAQSPRLAAPVADIIGALAYTLMVFKMSDGEEPFDSEKTERILITLLKPRDNKLVQDRLLEALASLYGNVDLCVRIKHSEAKKVLVGLVTMANGDAQEYLIVSLIRLCTEGVNAWEALGKREGIQLLISSLGLSSEQHQEYVVEMLAILIEQVDDSKWAITAAGGIPPLVRLIEVGSWKAKEDSTCLLSNLCSYSEEIRACVEKAKAFPAFLSLLKNGGERGQEESALALIKLIKTPDSNAIDQLLSLLLGDAPSSKNNVIKVLGHLLSMASHRDLVNKRAAAYKGLSSLVQALDSSNCKTQEYAASVLADIFKSRKDVCDSLATDEVVNPYIKLLTGKTPWAQGLSVLSRKVTNMGSYIAEGDVKSLIKLAKTSHIDTAGAAMAALGNLLPDPQLAGEAMAEDVVSAITRVLGEGSLEGKKSAIHALHQLLNHFPVGDVFTENSQCRFLIGAIVDSLNVMDMDSKDAADALEVLALLSRAKHQRNGYPPTFTYSLESLVYFVCEGPPMIQDKAIEILSRLSVDQPVVLGDVLVSNPRSIGALANRVTKSSSLEVRVGGTTLLVCAARKHKIQSMDALDASGYLKPLIYALLDMSKLNGTPRGLRDKSVFRDWNDYDFLDPTIVSQGTIALWLLSIVSSSHSKNKITVMEAGGLEVVFDKLNNKGQGQVEDSEGTWISAFLASILFQEGTIASSPKTMLFVPSLVELLKSDEMIDRLFAAQAMASLVCHGDKGLNIALANSGAIAGLTTIIGHVELDTPHLTALSEEFSLQKNPVQIVLETLFQIDDVRVGSVARNTIPLLVDILKPIPDRPGAPPFVVRLLSQIADGNDTNKLIMAESGALDSLTKYLSLSPQDLTEATISELFRILFSNSDLLRYKAASTSCLNQLIAVLHLGSRNARLSAARALEQLFDADHVRDSEPSLQAIQPLAEMLGSTSEREQKAALSALIKLTSDSDTKATMLAEVEFDPLHSLYKILTSNSDLELKSDAAELCCVLFGNSKVAETSIASECVQPLMNLMQSGNETAVESGVCAFERLLDNEVQLEITSVQNLVGLLVGLVSGSNYRLIEASICALIKLGKDRTPRKLDMVNAGVIENCLELLPTAPDSLCAAIAELFRILTNSSAISKTTTAAKIVEPLFAILLKMDLGLSGKHSALQTLVNILEKPHNLSSLKLTPSQVVDPLIPFLESPSQAIQELGTELLSHLLAQDHFKEDITTKSVVVPLVRLAGIGILNLQQTAIKSLESISLSWPKVVVDAGGISELSKLITQNDPLPPEDLWESAASVLSNLLQSGEDYYFKVPIPALVRMLHSVDVEKNVTIALNALIVQEKADGSISEFMAEVGAIDALLDLLRSHQCEEPSGKLLEALFNNLRVREMKACKHAIAPLAQYLLDPQTTSQNAKLVVTLALGNLSQHEGLAKASDSVYACRALIVLLEEQPTEEITMVAVCALQNFVMRSRTNRRVVAEGGGVIVIQELLQSLNPEIVVQAALLIKILFSNHTLQEYVSNELIRTLTSALEKELQTTVAVHEEVLKTIHVIFSNFHKLHISEATTFCIPHLVTALKSGNEAAQDSVLTILCLLKQSWPSMPSDVSRSQATAAGEAIPTLQALLKTCPPIFLERVESLLKCLPGCLTITVKRANNLKQVNGGTYAYCRLSIGNGPARRTKVSNSNSPEWKETFTWAFDTPPKGQKLHIACRNKSTFGKSTLGRVAIQIDEVVSEGEQSGVFNLSEDNNKDGASRTLEIEITWSNT